MNEPANYVVAACLPTLRPIFIRVLPASFFVLSNKRSSNRPTDSSKKAKKGSSDKGISLHVTNPCFTGPWQSQYVPEDLENDTHHANGYDWPGKCQTITQTLEVDSTEHLRPC